MYDIACRASEGKQKLEVYFSPKPISYSFQVFDDKRVSVSIFEMYRNYKISSPILLINFSENEKLTNFLKKEINGLLRDSKVAGD
jgi:hypothetical protein